MTGFISIRFLPICTGFYGTEIKYIHTHKNNKISALIKNRITILAWQCRLPN